MERKGFRQWQVELVYRKQDGVCIKCGNSLGHGFHRHHKDGDPANNAVANLTLLCGTCHGGEAFKTLVAKKTKALGDVEAAIQMGIEGKLSGAAMDKLLDAIKLGLSLVGQVYGKDIEKPPASIRMENYLVSSGLLLKEYERGVREGIQLGVNLASSIEIVTAPISSKKEAKKA